MLGERIYKLRTEKGMSQGDLAEKLNVSRQTISKWENNLCAPETEKLVSLSEIFSVSIDFLIKGEEKAPADKEKVYVYLKNDSENTSSQKNKSLGVALTVSGLISSVVILALGGGLFCAITLAVFLLGILLIFNVKHPYLILFWSFYIITVTVMPRISALNLSAVFQKYYYCPQLAFNLALSYCLWLILAVLIFSTVKAIKKNKQK